MDSAAAFFSYVHSDDEYEGGQISRLRDLLQGEVRMQLGDQTFEIFIDRKNVAWGQNWKRRIDGSLGAVTLLIPVVTPAFFASKECRRELERFLERELELGRDDLILPLYYLDAVQLAAHEGRERDPLAQELSARQHADWRELRFEPFTSPVVRQRISQLAARMRESLTRGAPEASSPEPERSPSPQPTSTQPDTASEPAGGKSGGRNEPPTLVVDPWGRGDHASIGPAIAAAGPGTRILVEEGLYEEGLIIDKPLEILGQGRREEIIVRAKDADAVLFSANIGRVSNLTLQQSGGGNFYAVDIAQGRLELEDCDITSASLAGVGVHSGADPRLRRNAIHDGEATGIFVYDEGLGTFEDNEIYANKSGIQVREHGNPTCRRNRIHDNEQAGVYVFKEGLGTFEANDIFANGGAGVNVSEGGNPTVRANQIHDGRAGGVFVYEQGLGTFEDNEIYANARAGIEVSECGSPTARGNLINRNGYEAVWVHTGGRGTFEDNDLTDNKRGAWDIEAESDEYVERRDNQE